MFPSMRPTRPMRLTGVLETDHKNRFPEIVSNDTDTHLLQSTRNLRDNEDTLQHHNNMISIVEMSTLICKSFHNTTVNDFDEQIDVKYSPMMPLTIELMRRKSLYYMGLEPSLFFRFLHIMQTTFSDITDALLLEVKLMLVLRKHRFNEELEALGDLFDIDKATTQRYVNESKELICNLYHSLTNAISSPAIQELDDEKKSLLTKDRRLDEDDQSSSDDVKYKGYRSEDKDFSADVRSDSTSSDDSIDLDASSDSLNESNEKECEKNLVKETVKCPLCKKIVVRLDYHMETNHLSQQYLNKTLCGLCLRKFETQKELCDHQINIHNGAAYVCDVCDKNFQKFSAVKEHILKVHSKSKPFLCHQCGASYYNAFKLKTHIKNAHLQIRNYECKLCDKKYCQAKELETHIRATHTKDRPFHCRFACGKSFGRSSARYVHEQSHKTKFCCEICKKNFSFKHNLRTHCKNIHGRNVIDTEKCKIVISQ